MRHHPWRTIGVLGATLIAGPAAADLLAGQVVGVSDGDTVTMLTEEHVQVKVRIAGIDAPENGQPFGQAAKSSMFDCAFGKQAQVEWRKLDRYGRTIGKLTVDGLDCGLRQVEMGFAWHYKAYAREQSAEDRQAYAKSETVARAAAKGLWRDAHPIPPWDYRHPARSEAAP
jgi:endonuclease YncB( thermonuclease family)